MEFSPNQSGAGSGARLRDLAQACGRRFHQLRLLVPAPLGVGALLLLALGTTVGLSRLLTDHLEDHLEQKVLESQKQKIRGRVMGLDANLRQAERSVQRFARLISYRSNDLANEDPALEAIASRDAQGSWRLPRQRFDPHSEANLWVPPSVPLTQENRRFFRRSLTITRVFGLGAQNEVVENAWMLPLVGGMTAFWPANPSYLYNADAQLDYRSTPWLTQTNPRHNPGRAVRWVGPEYDPAPRDWSISVVAPFFRDDQWAGSVGHDMRVSHLFRSLLDPGGSGKETISQLLWLTNAEGRVLAKRGGAPSPQEKVPERIWRQLSQQGAGERWTVLAEGSDFLLALPIPTLQAQAVYEVDGDWIHRKIRDEIWLLQTAEAAFVLLAIGAVLALAAKDAQGRRQHQLLLEQRNVDLERLSRLDQLTQLPNRRGLQERCGRALERARRIGSPCLVAFLDLDRFKTVNDSLGHAVGDGLLVAVAERLRRTVGPGDTVARLGGDEFVVLREAEQGVLDGVELVEKLHRCLEQPLEVQGHQLTVTASIGVSCYPGDGEAIDTLMRQADMAMYEVKNQGRNGWLFFDEAMNRRIQERRNMELDVRKSLDREDFRLNYQPQWDISGRRLVGWEALLRWSHPQWGALSPATFIAVAEDSGLIGPLGDWVLLHACRQAASWQQAGESLASCRLSVNLSCRQFSNGRLEERIAQILEQSGLSPHRLELEITETVLMDDPQRASSLLRRLKQWGIRIAIDDFGTGYSSLGYLRSFPIDRIKIDRSFVGASFSDPSGAAIVTAIISMARSLGITTIAEGVETEEQRLFLQDLGCDEFQGFLMGEPMAPETISAYLSCQKLAPPRP